MRRVLTEDELLAELKAARRVGIKSLDVMRANVTAHLEHAKQDIGKEWPKRHPELNLRSLDWPEPRRTEVAAGWDDYDRAQQVQNRIAARKSLRKHVANVQTAKQILAWLGPWVEDDSTVYLRWRNDPRYRDTIAVLDAAGNVVAEVYKAGGPGPTIRAVIYAPPFTQGPSVALYDRGGRHDGAELASATVRQRKQAVAWLVTELHKRCYGIWRNEIDLPEWSGK